MAVAVCAAAPAIMLPTTLQSDDKQLNERFYKFGTPSPLSVGSPAAVYSDLEDSGFHSDEEIQKVSKCLFTRVP